VVRAKRAIGRHRPPSSSIRSHETIVSLIGNTPIAAVSSSGPGSTVAGTPLAKKFSAKESS
jgi:hypothetical protein